VQQNFTIAINSTPPEYAGMRMKEIQYIHYAGPSMIFRQWLDKNKKLHLTETISAGYVHYRDESRMKLFSPDYVSPPIYEILAKGKTCGANANLSFGFFPVSHLSVGVNAGFMYARLTKVVISAQNITQTIKLDKKDYEYLTRFDYSLNVCFHF